MTTYKKLGQQDILTGVIKQMATQSMGTRYWGRANPIHWHPDYARSQGFSAPIATGEMSSAFIAEMLTYHFGQYVWEGARIQCKYIQPIYAGDTITTSGVVQEKKKFNGKTRWVIEIWAENQEGTKVTVGKAELTTPETE